MKYTVTLLGLTSFASALSLPGLPFLSSSRAITPRAGVAYGLSIPPCPTADETARYKDNLVKQQTGQCGPACQASIGSYQSKNSQCHGVQLVGAPPAVSCPTPAETAKYKDNLVKQQTGQCGPACQASIGSYQSKASQCHHKKNKKRDATPPPPPPPPPFRHRLLAARGTPCPTTDEERNKYLNHLLSKLNGNCGPGCDASISSYNAKVQRCGPPNSVVQSVLAAGCPPSAAEVKDYKANVAKLQAGKCDQACVAGLNDYRAKSDACTGKV